MVKGILGKKLGMTQVFTPEGIVIPVTVIEATPNVVVRNMTEETNGYHAVQIGFGSVKEKHLTKPEKGHFEKVGVTPVKFLRELRLAEASAHEVGSQIGVDIFEDGEIVDVTGVAKGKGFAGTIKRHGFSRGPMTHGSKSHREPGSIGPMTSGGGGRVFKGKKLPGHMGNHKVTVQRLTLVRVDKDRNLLLIKGAVPGPQGGLVMVRNTVKPRR
jgi:50S ribosomal protein L3, bacterial